MLFQKPQISNVSNIDICPVAQKVKASSHTQTFRISSSQVSITKEVYELKIHMHTRRRLLTVYPRHHPMHVRIIGDTALLNKKEGGLRVLCSFSDCPEVSDPYDNGYDNGCYYG